MWEEPRLFFDADMDALYTYIVADTSIAPGVLFIHRLVVNVKGRL